MKKMITPIIITILVVAFFIFQVVGLINIISGTYNMGGLWISVLWLIIILGVLSALIYNLYKRIKEIKEEDDDDLSKY